MTTRGRSFQADCADARPWLYGIARNVLRAYWRAAAGAGPPAAEDRPAAEEQNDPWDDVVERLDSAARARTLAGAVRALPPGERDVLLLVAWEQLTPAEAAVVLGARELLWTVVAAEMLAGAAPGQRASHAPGQAASSGPGRAAGRAVEQAGRHQADAGS
jgi:hypothetical protein